MANLQALAVEFGAVFPCGVGMVGEVDRQNDFERSSKDNSGAGPGQGDGAAGLGGRGDRLRPEGPDQDLQGQGGRGDAAGAAPEALPGAPIRPLVLEGMTVTPYIADGPRPKIAYSLRCTGLAAPGRRSVEHGKVA